MLKFYFTVRLLMPLESLDTENIPRFEYYVDLDRRFHVDAFYAKEDE